MKPNVNTPESFWSRVDRTGECWLWTGSIDAKTGYGRLHYQGRQVTAHRLAYELVRGPVPAGLYVCHSCDNRPCCRPSHFWAGTYADNMRDAFDKGRIQRGEAHGNAKLRPAAVLLIRALRAAGVPGVVIARRFDVNPNTVYNIAAGRIWGWL
jgi:hypothetical protein